MYYPQVYESLPGGGPQEIAAVYAKLNGYLLGNISALFHPKPGTWSLGSSKQSPRIWRVRLEVAKDAEDGAPLAPHFILDIGENSGEIGNGDSLKTAAGVYPLEVRFRDVLTVPVPVTKTAASAALYANEVQAITGSFRIFIKAGLLPRECHNIAVHVVGNYVSGFRSELPNHYIQLAETDLGFKGIAP